MGGGKGSGPPAEIHKVLYVVVIEILVPNAMGPIASRGRSVLSGADPGFLDRGFICIKGWGFALLILSHYS